MYRMIKNIKWLLEKQAEIKFVYRMYRMIKNNGRFSVVGGPLCTEMGAESPLTRVSWFRTTTTY